MEEYVGPPAPLIPLPLLRKGLPHMGEIIPASIMVSHYKKTLSVILRFSPAPLWNSSMPFLAFFTFFFHALLQPTAYSLKSKT